MRKYKVGDVVLTKCLAGDFPCLLHNGTIKLHQIPPGTKGVITSIMRGAIGFEFFMKGKILYLHLYNNEII